MERDQLKFAAFVMTYKRQFIAKQTIEALFDQTIPPQKVLIIDNDEHQSGKIIQEQLAHLPIEYYAVRYNSGPAGAAAKGLQKLVNEGYDWIAWIDDDDPPYFSDVFEKLLQLAQTNPKCGCVGVVGQYFDRKKGLINRVPDSVLNGVGVLEIDTIAGNMIKLINSEVIIKSNILPDTSLFFGFEELDYDLRIQQAGYKLLVDKDLFLQHRIYHNRLHIEKIAIKKSERQLVRDYYSSRNMLYILKKNRLLSAFFYTLLRIAYKCVITFKFGFSQGMLNLKYQSKAIFHFVISRYGQLN
jgi:GT2 family glycosyltransferase